MERLKKLKISETFKMFPQFEEFADESLSFSYDEDILVLSSRGTCPPELLIFSKGAGSAPPIIFRTYEEKEGEKKWDVSAHLRIEDRWGFLISAAADTMEFCSFVDELIDLMNRD